MSHTFVVSEKTCLGRLSKMEHFLASEYSQMRRKLRGDTMHASPTQIVEGGHSPLFQAISYAFNRHYPLKITPDAVWLMCLVGLSHHIDTDPEGLRHHFVKHEGKVEIVVKVESPRLPYVPPQVWEDGIAQFSEKIKDHIGKKHDLIVCDFTTTTHKDRLSSEIAMMGALKHYFKYKMVLACGLSLVTVAGEPEDWANLYQRVEALTEFDLGWWTQHLLPVIDQLRIACEGNPDLDFWNRVYKKEGYGSGSQGNVTGWVNVFHPYIAGKNKEQMLRNKYVDWQDERGSGVETDDFPYGLVSAPVELDDHGIVYDFEFYGGLVGVAYDEEYTVEAVSGWAIQNLGLAKPE